MRHKRVHEYQTSIYLAALSVFARTRLWWHKSKLIKQYTEYLEITLDYDFDESFHDDKKLQVWGWSVENLSGAH